MTSTQPPPDRLKNRSKMPLHRRETHRQPTTINCRRIRCTTAPVSAAVQGLHTDSPTTSDELFIDVTTDG